MFRLLVGLFFLPLVLQAETDSFPVQLRGREILRISQGSGFLSAQERALVIGNRLEKALGGSQNPTLALRPAGTAFEILADDLVLMQVTPEDAAASGQTAEHQARNIKDLLEARLSESPSSGVPIRLVSGSSRLDAYLASLTDLLDTYHLNRNIIHGLMVLAILGLLFVLLWILRKIFAQIYQKLDRIKAWIRRPVAMGKVEIFSLDQLRFFMEHSLRTLHAAAVLLLVYTGLNAIILLLPLDSSWGLREYIRAIVYTVLLSIVALAVRRAGQRMFLALSGSKLLLEKGLLRDIRFQNMVLFSQEQLSAVVLFLLSLVRIVFVLGLTYSYAVFVLSFFPFSQGWTGQLSGYVMEPLKTIVFGVIAYLPNVLLIAMIGAAAVYSIRFTRFFFGEIEKGRIRLPGFYPDWALPTHRIVTFVLIAFAAIVVFPYLPGANSEAFKGVSLFIGFLISLSSSTVLANVIAGLVVTYTRPFAVGDRVKIADTMGDVTAMTLLVTRIRTAKNIEITIPNGMVLASHIFNFSAGARRGGVILHTSVTIGYDVPFAKVEAMLVEAATRTDLVLADPAPFVLQTGLEDFYVSYEVNAYTGQPGRMAAIYSDLHRNIQRVFFAHGVEILSPHYRAVRDGSEVAIPAQATSASATPAQVLGSKKVSQKKRLSQVKRSTSKARTTR